MTSRWSRTFSRLATFSEDLGDLGASVVESTSVRHEDIVLRRLLIAQKRSLEAAVGSLKDEFG